GARGDVGVEPVQRGEHAVELLVAQQPGAVQHAGVRAGSRDVVAGEPPVEVRRDAQRGQRVGGAAGEPAAPQADPPLLVPAHACSPSCRPSWSRSPSASARNRAAVAAPPSGSVVITSTVSSPAIEPSTCGITASSIAEARNCAAPGGVRSTTMLPDAAALTSSSAHSRPSRAASCSAPGLLAGAVVPSAGSAYWSDPSAVRTLWARSSSRSRDSVACVTATPSCASASSSSAWLCTARLLTTRRMSACRAGLVAGALIGG